MDLDAVLNRVDEILGRRQDLSWRDVRQLHLRADDVRHVMDHIGRPQMLQMGPGRFCGTVVMYLLFSRSPTISMVTVFQRYVKVLAELILKEFNLPNTLTNQKIIFEDPAYVSIKTFARRVLGSVEHNTTHSVPMMHCDVHRILRSIQWDLRGLALSLMISVASHTGCRCVSLLLCTLNSLDRLSNSLEYFCDKGVGQITRTYMLTQAEVRMMNRYLRARGSSHGPLFPFEETERVDELLYDAAYAAGYPKKYFSFHSLRSVFFCQVVLDNLIANRDEMEAVERASNICGWSIRGGAWQTYHRGLIGRFRGILRDADEQGLARREVQITPSTVHPDIVLGVQLAVGWGRGAAMNATAHQQLQEICESFGLDGPLNFELDREWSEGHAFEHACAILGRYFRQQGVAGFRELVDLVRRRRRYAYRYTAEARVISNALRLGLLDRLCGSGWENRREIGLQIEGELRETLLLNVYSNRRHYRRGRRRVERVLEFSRTIDDLAFVTHHTNRVGCRRNVVDKEGNIVRRAGDGRI